MFGRSLLPFTTVSSFPQKVMAIAMLMLVNTLLYTLCMREDINLKQFLLLFIIGSKSRPSSGHYWSPGSQSDPLILPFVSCQSVLQKLSLLQVCCCNKFRFWWSSYIHKAEYYTKSDLIFLLFLLWATWLLIQHINKQLNFSYFPYYYYYYYYYHYCCCCCCCHCQYKFLSKWLLHWYNKHALIIAITLYEF